MVTVDVAQADPGALRAELEARLGVPVISLEVRDVDYVRETTRVQVRLAQRPAHGRPTVGEDAARVGGA
jgi:hypothetical protein